MFKQNAIATVASAIAVASLAFAGVTVAINGTRPAPVTDTMQLDAAVQRAETAEAEHNNLAAQLAQARQDARYTACMYALQTLDPTDPDMARWSCTRNVDQFAYLPLGSEWDARQYGE
jgi:hypothetical protein